MTYTRAIGVVCGAIIDRIVRWLALSRIHPDVLTFIGLVINIWAAWLFARAGSAVDPRVDFRWAAVVIIGALFGRMAAVLWVIAVLSNLTVIHRMIYTWREATRLEDAQLRAVPDRQIR